jgi:choline dehydrogenase
LRKLGIGVVRDLPAVGSNFYDDLGVGTLVEPTLPFPPQPYGYVPAGVFGSSKGTPGHPAAYGDVDIEVQVSTSDLPGCPPLPFPLPSRYCTVGSSALHLKSRGTVTLASADPYAAPLVDPAWLSDPDDLAHCRAALDLTFRIASDSELCSRWGWKVVPLFDATTASRDNYIRLTGLTVQHYVGSCRMGPDASDAVVDAELCVHGVNGLRVIDASVAPTPVTGNTAGVSMVIGARGAAHLLNTAS